LEQHENGARKERLKGSRHIPDFELLGDWGDEQVARAKGTVVVGLVRALRKNKERARELLPNHLLKYLDERIVVASWYPLDDYITLLRTVGKVIGKGTTETYIEMGRVAAKDHMEGTYSRLKKSVNRQAAFTLLSSMYDTGEMRVVERAPGRALLEWANFAQPTREVCETFTGYQMQRMEAQGFEEVHVRHTKCRAEGAGTCRWEIAWKGRAML
jgi:hypothetical protein